MHSKVSIIILNYNGLQFNKNCLDSLLTQSYENFEIVFVNNLSTDGSYEEVKKIFHKQIEEEKIKLIDPGKNLGFAGGNNYGVSHSDANSEYICLLNNDTLAPKDRLENLVEGIESDNTLGAVGAVIYDKGYEQQTDTLIYTDHKKGVNNYFFDSITIDQTQEDKEGNILYTTAVGGCCLLYKKALLKQPFEEMYFAYMEDTALCLQIILQGYRVGMVKTSRIQHFGSGSFGKKPNIMKSFHGIKNYILNFLVFSQGYFWIAVLPFFLLGIGVRTFINYPGIRLKGLFKALVRISKNRKNIKNYRENIKVNIPPKSFYSQLSKEFIYMPFMPSNRFIQGSVNILNSLSKVYFNLVGFFVNYDKKN